MTSLDILFWLLIALMGGIAWAIEAGLGQRHRNALASSMLAALGSVLIMMFLIEDNSVMKMFAPPEDPKGGANQEEEAEEALGEVDFGRKKKKRKTAAAGKGGAPAKNEASAGTSAQSDTKDKDVPGGAKDDGKIEYNREPFRDCPQCPEMVIMSVGTAQTGSPPDEAGRMPGEANAKQTIIEKPFAIGRVEVTRAQFTAFVKATSYITQTQCETGKRRGQFDWSRPGIEQDERHSVVCVSIRDVTAYVDWLSDTSGRMYALPTEIEWEYAARAGTDTPYWVGDSLNRTQANIARSRDGTTPGGLFPMNPFGLADMAGNAWEMTSGCLPEPTTDGAPPVMPAATPPTCKRLIKGGGWNAPATEARHAARSFILDGTASNFVGFRVIRSVDQRDAHMILTPAEKLAIEKAKTDAITLSAQEQEAFEKATLDNRERAIKLGKIAKDKAAAKAKTKSDAVAKAQADALKEADNPKAKKK